MNSVDMCRSWLDNDALFLDTETTGVDESAEIIEIAVIDKEEWPVYETLVLTTEGTYHAKAGSPARHRGNAMVAEALRFWEIHGDLCRKLKGRLLRAYGADFDTRLIRQTCELYKLENLSCRWGVQCRCTGTISDNRKG